MNERSEARYQDLMRLDEISGLTTDEALTHLGELTDLSLDLKKTEGLQQAKRLSMAVSERQLTDTQHVVYHYNAGNIRGNVLTLSRLGTPSAWDWEQPELEEQILHYRTALDGLDQEDVPDELLCQVFTNLANSLNYSGRVVEAIEQWNLALSRVNSFPMAIGNKAYGYIRYAKALYDDGHVAVLLHSALVDLRQVESLPLDDAAKRFFRRHREWIETVLSTEFVEKGPNLDDFSLGSTDEETEYRSWALASRLFLNPLNDLGPLPIAARDVLCTPSMVTSLGVGPKYQGLFDQMKQEFVSARYLLHQALTSDAVHFSDRDVTMINTLDYPAYGLSVEQAKLAFRAGYSLLDKVAYFLNDYLNLKIPSRQVQFRTIWYQSGRKKEGLRPEFVSRPNGPLRGLFWLSKDLFEEGLESALQPDAREMSNIRNHLEHKYLKLHMDMWSRDETEKASDGFAYSLHRTAFEAKSLRILKLARAALVYLALALTDEERKRARERDPKTVTVPMFTDIWEDDWKI